MMPITMVSARRDIHQMKSALDAMYERYKESVLEVPISIQQDLHLYVCVRLSGYLEQLLHQAICAYVAETASPATQNFALSWFKRAPNLKPKTLEELIERFDNDLIHDLQRLLDKGNNRSLLGTLLKIRNDTAHGKSYQGSTSNVASYKALIDDIHAWVHRNMITPVPR